MSAGEEYLLPADQLMVWMEAAVVCWDSIKLNWKEWHSKVLAL